MRTLTPGQVLPSNAQSTLQSVALERTPPRTRAWFVLTFPVAVLVAVLVLITLLGAGPSSAAAPSSDIKLTADLGLDHVASRVLLKLKPGARLDDVTRRSGLELVLVRPTLLGWSLYRITNLPPDDASLLLKTIAALDDDPAVEHAQPERWYRPLAVPNDPFFDAMWHLEDIGIETAWDHTTGLSTQRIGVVDTGTLRNHEELVGKDVSGWDFISDGWQAADADARDADYTDLGDAANCGGQQRPNSWHGSHVAGTILASTNNSLGIAGINQEASLVTARAMGRCGGSLVDIMEGAAWMAGASVDGVPDVGADQVSAINLSLGGSGPCTFYEQDILDWVADQGVIVVAASGNDGGEVNSPANCGNVVTVAASSPNGSLTGYSSFDSSVEIVAPGGQMFNAQDQAVLSLAGPGDSDYQWSQGTSMAAPHVTGAVSLIQALNPALTRLQIVQIVTDTGDSCGGCLGKPLLRLDAALDFVATGQLPVPPPDDDLAGNDSPAHAAEIGCGQSYDLIMIPGGEDWFSFSADEGLLVTVDVVASPDFDLDVYLYTDGGAQEIGRSAGPTGDESVIISAPDELLHLAVLSWDGAAGDYGLSVSCEDLDDELEPNDGPAEAAPLGCHSEHDLFMAPGDRDWFRLEVEDGEPFELSIEAVGADGAVVEDVDLDLYITSGGTMDDVVAESTSPTGQELVTFATGDGAGISELWAVVVPFRDASGPYRLSFSCPDRPIPEEPEEPTPPVEVEDPIEEPGLGMGSPIAELIGGCSHTGAGGPAPLVGLVLLAGGMVGLRRRRSGAGDAGEPQ